MKHPSGDWHALRLFNLYRMVLSGLLVTLLILPQVNLSAALWSPTFFGAVALLYLVAAVGFSFTIRAQERSGQEQLQLQIVVDILVLSLLGLSSGHPVEIFGALLLIPVAFAGYWQPGRLTQFYAALALLGVLGAALVHQLLGHRDYPVAGLGALALVLLSIALFSGLSRRRSAATQAIDHQRARHLASLTELNAFIVQRMEEGVIIVDEEDQVCLHNPVAARFFSPLERAPRPLPLDRVSPMLEDQLRAWRRGEAYDADRLSPLRLQITALQPQRQGMVMLLLEDTSAQNSRLQREKLAALGRLTASLAHEIRNPLGAIGHAVQLLAESAHLTEEDRHLLAMVRRQSQRLNQLIEEILTLSRRKAPRWQPVNPQSWLQELLDEWQLTWPDVGCHLQLDLALEEGEQTPLQVDPTHLRQVLVILIDNALRHARQPDRELQLQLRLFRQQPAGTLCLELCDNGPGIDPGLRQQIWEPFFSSHSEGTGLGLYLARELCDANYADLSYSSADGGGGCFRIAFPMERPLTQPTHD